MTARVPHPAAGQPHTRPVPEPPQPGRLRDGRRVPGRRSYAVRKASLDPHLSDSVISVTAVQVSRRARTIPELAEKSAEIRHAWRPARRSRSREPDKLSKMKVGDPAMS